MEHHTKTFDPEIIKKKKFLKNRQLGINQSSRPLKERNFSPIQILELFQKRIKEKYRLGKPGDKTI